MNAHSTMPYMASVTITNPGGAGVTGQFQVALQPSISNISPAQVAATQPTTLTIAGGNFQNGLTVSVTSPAGTFPLTSAAVTFVNSSQIRVQVTMNAHSTMPYTASATITNPGGRGVIGSFQVVN